MKTCNLSVATVVLGALAVSYTACSAEGQDNAVPGAPTSASIAAAGSSNHNTAGSTSSGGAPVVGNAGAAPASRAGAGHVGGAFSGSGGARPNGGSTGRAGAPSSGVAGAVQSGGAGAPTTGGCTITAGALTDLLIDDLEDGDDAIRPIGSRIGYWYTYNDGSAKQVPDPGALFKGTAPGSTTSAKFAATTSGPAFTMYGAGMGFAFNNPAKKACPYNASAYTGIKFKAKANTGNMSTMTLKAMIKIPGTTPSTADSGTCTGTMCEDHYYLKPAPKLTTAWAEYTMPFASIQQDGFGPKVAFDKSKIIAMQFQVAQNVAFNFSIDDITFY